MEIRVATLRRLFTVTGLLFFCGFIGFGFRVAAGGGGAESQSADVEGNVINQLLGLAILAVCVFLGFRRKLLVSARFWRENWAFLAFVAFIFSSIAWSIEPAITAKRCIALISVAAFAIYLTEIYTTAQIYRMVGLAFGVAAALGLLWALIAPGKAFVAGGIREGAFLGIFSDKNGGARAYVLAILMLLPFTLERERWALVATACCLACLALAQSASGIMLLMIGGATAIYLRHLSGRTNLRINASTVILGLCVYAFCAFSAVVGYQFVLELAGRDPTLTDRTVMWDLLTPLVMDKLFLGYGFGAFWAGWGAEEFIERWGYTGNAHNGYIEVLLHGGVGLFTVFVFMILSPLLALIATLIKTGRPIVPAVAIAIILQMLVANFIAYALPNYRSFDFLIFMLVYFAAVKSVSAARRDVGAGL